MNARCRSALVSRETIGDASVGSVLGHSMGSYGDRRANCASGEPDLASFGSVSNLVWCILVEHRFGVQGHFFAFRVISADRVWILVREHITLEQTEGGEEVQLCDRCTGKCVEIFGWIFGEFWLSYWRLRNFQRI